MEFQTISTDPAVTGLAVWLQQEEQEVKNGSANDPILADPVHQSGISTDENVVLPPPGLDMENIVGTQGASTSRTGGTGDNGEFDLPVLPPIITRRSVEAENFLAQDRGALERIREETDDVGSENHICRHGCGRDDENPDRNSSLDALVELGCLCSGTLRRMCLRCMLRWYGPRIAVENDMTCEICQTQMDESVRTTVLRAMADHTGARDVLVKALGPPLMLAHMARTHARGPVDQEHVEAPDGDANELPEFPIRRRRAPNRTVLPSGRAVPPPATPSSPSFPSSPISQVSGPEATGPPIPARTSRRSPSFLTRMRRYMCWTMPTRE